MDMGKANIIILRGLFGLFLVLVLLFCVFAGKSYGLLVLLLALGLLCLEKPKTILPWLAKTLLFGLAGLVLALGLLFLVRTWRMYTYVPEGKAMYTSISPSGWFTVSAYSSPFRFSLPGFGQGGCEHPALFILRDDRTGKELQRRHVSGFWCEYDVYWHEDHVVLRKWEDRIVWPLPPDEPAR
jgi:hypothetical protein